MYFAYPWGEGELAHDAPDQWQAEVLTQIGEALRAEAASGDMRAVQMAIASGHGIGKTALSSWVIHWWMSTRLNCAGSVTANTYVQLVNKTWRELGKWVRRSINAHWFRVTKTAIAHAANPAEWFIAPQSSNEHNAEAFAGTHERDVLMLFDEASAIPDAIWETASGAMTDGAGLWLNLGNPTKNTGRFRECFGRYKHRWITRQIDSRDTKRANKKQIAEWKEDYGEDSDYFRVRVRGVFPRVGDMQFIASDIVHEAAQRIVQPQDEAPLVMGVDVARFGSDDTVMTFRRGRDARSIPSLVFPGQETMQDTMQTAYRAAEEAGKHGARAIFVDGTGLGGGVVDRLRELDIPGKPEIFDVQAGAAADGAHTDWFGSAKEACSNKSSECAAIMRRWLRIGAIPDDAGLKAELEGRIYGHDAEGRIQLEKKEHMKKRGLSSPNKFDALALTFAQPVSLTAKTGKAKEALRKRRRAGRGTAWR